MKTKIRVFFLIFFTVAMNSAYAQNARSILDKSSEAYAKAGGLSANFTLDSKDTKSKTIYSSDGKAYMSGNKFKIETPDALTWFDSKTQWVYVKDTEEVNISNPTDAELQSISPFAIFNIYKKGFTLTYNGEKTVAGKTVYEITMTPQTKSDLKKIVVQIDKATNIFSKITMTDKSNVENILTIKTLRTGLVLPDATFTFNKKDYPNAEVIDLR